MNLLSSGDLSNVSQVNDFHDCVGVVSTSTVGWVTPTSFSEGASDMA